MNKIAFAQNTLNKLSDKEIAEFKQKYGEVYHIKLNVKGCDEDKPEFKECWLHRPGRKELGHAHVESRKTNGDPYIYNEILAKDCWLAATRQFLRMIGIFSACRPSSMRL